MTKGLKGFQKIFGFTLRQHTKTKGYKGAVIGGALICLLLPVIIMAAIEVFGGSSGLPEGFQNSIQQVFVVDNTGTAPKDFGMLNGMGDASFMDIVYTDCGGGIDQAIALAGEDKNSLILAIDGDETSYSLSVLLPEDTVLTENDAESLSGFLQAGYVFLLIEGSGASYEDMTSPDAASENEKLEEYSPIDGVRDVLSMVISFISVMLMYFLVLFYGNGVANSVITEKSSKLMDNLLISVKPGAMVVGKTVAIALAGALQFLAWSASIVCGFALGTFVVKLINPETDMLLILLFETMGEYSGLFTVQGAILALLLVLAGFLMYCGLASVGASIAGKQEDLSSTNMLFALAVVASFLATLQSGTSVNTNTLLNWIPFTSTLIMPGRLILGEASILAGLGALGMTLLTALLIMLLAGRLYKMMALYRGNVPKPKQIFEMLKDSRGK